MVVHLDHIYVKFDYQDHWVKVKVTLVKLASWTVGNQICCDQLMALMLSLRNAYLSCWKW